MDTIKDAANYVGDKLGQGEHAAKQEGNKQQAKDSNATVGDRIQGAGNYIKEGAQKKGDEASAESNKPFGN